MEPWTVEVKEIEGKREGERNKKKKKAKRDRRYRLSTIVLHYGRHRCWQPASRRRHRPAEILQPRDRRSKVKRANDDEGDLQLRPGDRGKQAIGMFDVLAPGKLVLTLRSTPPFVAESAFALALTILLAAPLIVRVYLLLVRAPPYKLSCPSSGRG